MAVFPMSEEWREIPWSKHYAVSSLGRVRNTRTGRVLKQDKNCRGYMRCVLSVDSVARHVYVHRLVAEAFVPNDDASKTQVNHINENKSDNRAENLEWMTARENVNFGTNIERRSEKLSKPVLMKVGLVTVMFRSAAEAARRTGIPRTTVERVARARGTTRGARFEYALEACGKEE